MGCGILEGYALYEVCSSFPGIVKKEGMKTKGELYEIDERDIEALDYFEGNGRLYIRTREKIKLVNTGQKHEAWVYVWNGKYNESTLVPYHQQPWLERSLRVENRRSEY